MESFFCDFFHDAFAASYRDQIRGKKFRIKMVPGMFAGFRYTDKILKIANYLNKTLKISNLS